MNSRPVRVLLSLVLVTGLQAVTLLAADKPTAMLRSSGTTTVNGSDAATTTAVFDGDNIQTISGLVSISAPGSTVLVPSSSELVLKRNSVNLSSGVASINTTKGMTAQADAFTIAPATGGTAKFDVKRSGNLVEVHSSSGALTINSANQTIGVPEGQTAALNTNTGVLSAGLVNYSRNQTVAKSGSSVFDINKALGDDPTEKVKPCASAICYARHHVSNTKPCKCKWVE